MLFETCSSSSTTSSSSPPPPHSSAAAAGMAMAAAAAAYHHQQQQQQQQQQPQTSSRILYDIPCKVCSDHSSGKHYGIFACDGCAGFFKRSIRRNRQYVCKAKSEGSCLMDKTHRNQCRACRLKRCLNVGMNREAVQHERGPRNATLRRQMSIYFKEHLSAGGDANVSPPPPMTALPPPPPRQMSMPPATSTSSSPSTSPLAATATAVDFASPPKHSVASMTSNDRRGSAFAPAASALHLSTPPPPPPPAPPLPFFVDPRVLAAAAAASVSATSSTPAAAAIHHSPPPLPPHLPFFHPAAMAAAAATSPSGLLAPTPKYPHELTPPPLPPASSSDALSEAAARLLFMNVRWAQNVPAFVSLPYRDQMALLEATWRELFVLSAAQFSLPVEAAATATSDTAALTELKAFQETIGKFAALRVDPTEFACLRAVVLLKTSLESASGVGEKGAELRDLAAVSALQDQAQLTLSQYVAKAYPAQPQRFGKLLLLLPSLRAVSGKTVHALFFKCIGAIPLEKLICDMFKARGV